MHAPCTVQRFLVIGVTFSIQEEKKKKKKEMLHHNAVVWKRIAFFCFLCVLIAKKGT